MPATAPHTDSGLARGMAHGGHIHHEKYEFTVLEGQRPRLPSVVVQTSASEIWTPWSMADTLLELPSVAAS
jgi:hypothetical protein